MNPLTAAHLKFAVAKVWPYMMGALVVALFMGGAYAMTVDPQYGAYLLLSITLGVVIYLVVSVERLRMPAKGESRA